MISKPLQISTQDSATLAATLFTPGEESCNRTTIIINSGVAMRRRFYERFATYLCENGFTVVTYDYRGIGDSLNEPIKQCKATMADWACRDFAAVIETMAARYPQNTIKLVGHSFGGQILGVVPNQEKISAMLSIASQSGYWKLWPAPLRYGLAALWHGVMPGLSQLLSYFPAKRLKLGENLPAGAARQWASWCRTPNYLRSEMKAQGKDGFGEFRKEIRSLSFDDDREAPKKAVDALHAMYINAQVQREHIVTGDTDHKKIGHFGFFKLPADSALWQQSLHWLSSGVTNVRSTD